MYGGVAQVCVCLLGMHMQMPAHALHSLLNVDTNVKCESRIFLYLFILMFSLSLSIAGAYPDVQCLPQVLDY